MESSTCTTTIKHQNCLNFNFREYFSPHVYCWKPRDHFAASIFKCLQENIVSKNKFNILYLVFQLSFFFLDKVGIGKSILFDSLAIFLLNYLAIIQDFM